MGNKNGGIANELMKKFGTPNGAGPGDAKLNDGLVAVGTPPGERNGGGVVLGWLEVEREPEPEPEERDEW